MRIDYFPCGIITKHPGNQRRVYTVTSALSVYVTQHRHPEQREVADDVHDLVAHKLIRKAETFPIHDSAFRSKHYRIFK